MEKDSLIEGWEEDMILSDESDLNDKVADNGYNNQDLLSNNFISNKYINVVPVHYNEKLLEKMYKYYNELQQSARNPYNISNRNKLSKDYELHPPARNPYDNPSRSRLSNNFNEQPARNPYSISSRNRLPDENYRSDIYNPFEEANSDSLDYDIEFDTEVNAFLDEFSSSTLNNLSEIFELSQNQTNDINGINLPDTSLSQDIESLFNDEDYDSEESDVPVEVPPWFEKQINNKFNAAKDLLNHLANTHSYGNDKLTEYLSRLEEDHGTPFCKFDRPKHLPLNKPWNDFWKFLCINKCTELKNSAYHKHTIDCQYIELQHESTKITCRDRISKEDFPANVMSTVEEFEKFINESNKLKKSESEGVDQKNNRNPLWISLHIKSNEKGELMLCPIADEIYKVKDNIKYHFDSPLGRKLKIISCYFRQHQKQKIPNKLFGKLFLPVKFGEHTYNYEPKPMLYFNTVQLEFLGKKISKYLSLTTETTVLELGGSLISIIVAKKCCKVIGLSTAQADIDLCEDFLKKVKVHNCSFMVSKPTEVQTKVSAILKGCISVALINQDTVFGKSPDTMKALRNMPSVWKIVLYGSYKKDTRALSILTRDDPNSGDPFEPKEGCIIDKSPTISDSYDIIITFERKSLIEPTKTSFITQEQSKKKSTNRISVKKDLMPEKTFIDPSVIYNDHSDSENNPLSNNDDLSNVSDDKQDLEYLKRNPMYNTDSYNESTNINLDDYEEKYSQLRIKLEMDNPPLQNDTKREETSPPRNRNVELNPVQYLYDYDRIVKKEPEEPSCSNSEVKVKEETALKDDNFSISSYESGELNSVQTPLINLSSNRTSNYPHENIINTDFLINTQKSFINARASSSSYYNGNSEENIIVEEKLNQGPDLRDLLEQKKNIEKKLKKESTRSDDPDRNNDNRERYNYYNRDRNQRSLERRYKSRSPSLSPLRNRYSYRRSPNRNTRNRFDYNRHFSRRSDSSPERRSFKRSPSSERRRRRKDDYDRHSTSSSDNRTSRRSISLERRSPVKYNRSPDRRSKFRRSKSLDKRKSPNRESKHRRSKSKEKKSPDRVSKHRRSRSREKRRSRDRDSKSKKSESTERKKSPEKESKFRYKD